MKIISYNVNGIRSAISKGFFEWLAAEQPDIICLQEIKAMQGDVPVLELEALGYHHAWFSAEKKGYSGVATFSKKEADRVIYGCGIPDYDREGRILRSDLKVVTQRQPSEAELNDLLFAWTVAKHVKSNAIVYARDLATVGIGAGQMSRVDSTRIGKRKSEDMAEVLGLDQALTIGSSVASDAFFPFADGVEALAAAGAKAVIQPGGSMRDAEVIEAADRLGLAMVFTGQRHFRH